MGNLSDFGINTNPATGATGGGDFKPLPPGEYVLSIESTEDRDMNGKKQISFKLRVAEGEHTGRIVWDNCTVAGGSEAEVGRGKTVCGLYAKFAGKPDASDTSELIGSKVRVKLGINEYQGTVRNNIKAVVGPADGGPPETAARTASGKRIVADDDEIPF